METQFQNKNKCDELKLNLIKKLIIYFHITKQNKWRKRERKKEVKWKKLIKSERKKENLKRKLYSWNLRVFIVAVN